MSSIQLQLSAEEIDTGRTELANLLTELCKEVFDGRNASLGDGVQKALGREPRDFADFCKASAASGVWNPPS